MVRVAFTMEIDYLANLKNPEAGDFKVLDSGEENKI